MTRKSLLRFFLPIYLLFFTVDILAATPVVHISPKPNWLNTYKAYDKQIPARDVQDGFFYQLYEHQIQVESKAEYYHVARQIVSEAGIQNGSEISITFDPSYERLDFHNITVWRDGKPQNRLSANAFKMIADEEELSKFIYQGTYSAYCILSDIRKGDRIEFSYTLTGRNPILGNRFCADAYLQLTRPVAHIYLSVIASQQRKLNFKTFNNVPKVIQSVKNGLKSYEWESFQVPAGKDINTQPGWSSTYAYVQFSDFSNWNEVANWASNINPIPTVLTGELAKEVVALKAAAAGDKARYFREAVKLVQDEVRYMGIEMGEYSHRANRPENVFNQRYGDCKDKSLLLASLLKANSIPANMVLISTDSKSMTGQYLPTPYAFNHATVVSTVNGKQVWIDPTIAYQRGTGTELYYPAYGKGLIVSAASQGLTDIPLAKAGQINYAEVYKVGKDLNKITLDVTTTYTLDEADNIRSKMASTSISETEKNYLEYYQRIYPKIKSTDTVTIKDNVDKNELITIEHYIVPDFFKKDSLSNGYKASLYANYIDEQLTDLNTKYRCPRNLNFPYNVDYTIKVDLPGGWDNNKDKYELKRDAYRFASTATANGDTLLLNYKFSYLKDYLPANKIDEYAEDVKQLKDNRLGYTFTYTPGGGTSNFKLNYWMLLGFIGVILISVGLSIKIYRTETPAIVFEPGATFRPLGGWLIVIGIGLGISVISIFFTLIKNQYLNLSVFNSNVQHTIAYKIIFTLEALCNLITMCYAVFCLILMLSKRDIFPKFMIGLYAFSAIFIVLDHAAAGWLFGKSSSDELVMPIIRIVVIAGIWIPYFIRSSRVHETFIVPYPSTNYRYEEMSVPE